MKRIIYTIILVLLFISNIILVMQRQNFKEDIADLNSKITELEQQKKELESKPPVGWREYKDEKYNFKVWYPEKYNYLSGIYKVETDSFLYSPSKDNAIKRTDFSIQIPGDRPLGLLNIYIYDSNSSIEEFIKNDISTITWKVPEVERFIAEERQKGNTTIVFPLAQYTTKERFGNLDLYKLEIPNELLRYYIKNNGLIFAFTPDVSDLYPTDRQIFDQMVQSFQFTE